MWKVDLVESEAGWGQRVDEVKEFDTFEQALKYKASFNAGNTLGYVPDWYMYATAPYQ
jgi:hypothetical protein